MRTTEQILQEYGCKNDNDSIDKADAKSAMREYAQEAVQAFVESQTTIAAWNKIGLIEDQQRLDAFKNGLV